MILKEAQRELELAIAVRVVDLMIANTRSAKELVPQDVLEHFFGLACAERELAPDEGSARRILHGCAGLLKQRRAVADRLNTFLPTSTEDLIELRKKNALDARVARGRR